MKQTRLTLTTVLAFCGAAALFTACGEKKITIKVGDNWGASHPMAAALDSVFKPAIEKGFGGSTVVDVYHSGTLGNEADLWDGVRNGTIEVAIVGTPFNQEWPESKISDWPFLYRDLDHAKKVWTSPLADDLNMSFHMQFPTVYMLAWGPNSARTFTSNKQLTTVDGFTGQKFRMPGNPIHVGIAENLGASAQVIPLGDLFQALSSGIVDGQDNGMVTVKSESFYKVQKYLYETNHIIATLEIIVSAALYDSLSDAQKKIISDAARATSAQAWDDYIASIDADRAFLQAEGMTVTPCSPADQALIIQRIKPLTDSLYSENPWAQALTDKIKAVE
jgi:TRAP-type C4-dicarboxylate transport system substrate-binding protein